MSKSTHQIAVTGVDKTAKTFQSIQARAIATGNRISRVMGGAIAAAGAYLSFRAVGDGIAELGKLDDIAGKTKSSVLELTQAVTGFQILGIKTDIDSFSTALLQMRKNTGREGMSGFYATLTELGKIPDAAERSKAAVAAFGRAGLELTPLIDASRKGTDAIHGVIAAMPGIPDSAAKAGDDANDAMAIIGGEFKSIWYQAIGYVIELLGGDMNNGFRQAAAEAMANFEFGLKTGFVSVKMALAQIWRNTVGYLQQAGTAIGTAVGNNILAVKQGVSDLFSGKSFSAIYDNQVYIFKEGGKAVRDGWTKTGEKLDEELKALDKENQERVNKWQKELQTRLEAAKQLGINYKKVSEAMGNGGNEQTGEYEKNKDNKETTEEAVARAARITNDLIEAGSNKQMRLSVMGPEYQNEQKRQTEELKKIAENTKKTAEEVGGQETYEQTDVGA